MIKTFYHPKKKPSLYLSFTEFTFTKNALATELFNRITTFGEKNTVKMVERGVRIQEAIKPQLPRVAMATECHYPSTPSINITGVETTSHTRKPLTCDHYHSRCSVHFNGYSVVIVQFLSNWIFYVFFLFRYRKPHGIIFGGNSEKNRLWIRINQL